MEDDDIKGPLVFSCSNCKTIVGDSYAYICGNEQAKTITLSAANNIERSADVFTSKGGYDVGSTYFTFACSYCHTTIGRYYLTTSKGLDEIREKFTYFVNSLNSYELGKSKFGKIADPEVIIISEAAPSTSSTSTSEIPKLQELMTEILKVNIS